jgi:hypothetical protein
MHLGDLSQGKPLEKGRCNLRGWILTMYCQEKRNCFRRATILRRLQAHYQADLGALLAALGAQQRHHPCHFSFALPRCR